MAEQEIRLPNGVWHFDTARRLGRVGGFGAVYLGRDPEGNIVAIKKLHVDAEAASHREMKVAEELRKRRYHGVIPVFDSGEDANSGGYFVVMARAEMSLEEFVIAAGGRLREEDALAVIQEIANGLLEVATIVHRDLKPENILLLDGTWKIGDFGIAKFVADATSQNTLRQCLSPPYAAPEQWQGQQIGHPADVYALGGIAYRLLAGHTAFEGPTTEDFAAQHISQVPPPLDGVSPRISSLIALMLRKSPEGRPSLLRVTEILAAPQPTQMSALSKLAAANAVQVASKLEAEKAAMEAARREKIRLAHFETGIGIMEKMIQQLTDVAKSQLDHLEVKPGLNPTVRLTCGSGTMAVFVSRGGPIPIEEFAKSGWDVVCHGGISVRQTAQLGCSRSASFWFTNRGKDADFRWWEASYFRLGEGPHNDSPYALNRGDTPAADEAAGPALGVCRFGWGPRAIDHENQEDFMNRWLSVFANAINGRMRPPPTLPLTDTDW